jgi:hypothetical protein
MSVALLTGKNRHVTNLDLSVLYLLARPDTPPEVVDDMVTRSRAGEPVTAKIVHATIMTKRETVVVPYYKKPSEPEQLPGPMPLVGHSEPRVSYVDLPEPQLPASAARAVPPQAPRVFDQLAAIELPLPDMDELAKAYRAQSRVTVTSIRQLIDTLQELVVYLLADATADSCAIGHEALQGSSQGRNLRPTCSPGLRISLR